MRRNEKEGKIELAEGLIVLAQDSLIDGWYEAIVVGRTGDKVTLRSRDYPGYPNFAVPVTAVALVGPAAS
jgi:hypothetical protein